MGNTVREGFWDCSNCGETRILARYTECTRCDSPQNSVLTPAEDWYLPEGAPVITDAAWLAKSDLPAWNCGNCETLNDGDVTSCSHCNRPKDFDDTVNRKVTYDDRAGRFETKPDPLAEMIESDRQEADRLMATGLNSPRVMPDLTLPERDLPTIGRDTAFYEGIREGSAARFDERMRVSNLPPFVQKLYPHRKLILVVMIVLLIIGAIAGIVRTFHYYTATVPGTVTVSELHWERKVEVEEFKTLTDSDWSHPADARIQNVEEKVRSHRTVHDGWRTEYYTDYETHYRTESYTGYDTQYRSESYSYDCSYTVSNGNGTFTTVSRSCSGTRQVSYQVPSQKTRQVPYQVPVQKNRQVEITHQEPVYDTWYTYQVDRWTTDRWVTASDITSTTLIWPEPSDLSLNDQPGDQVGEERVGDERSASYSFVYTDANGSGRTETSDDDALWRKLEQGEAVPAHYYERNGQLSSVDWHAVA